MCKSIDPDLPKHEQGNEATETVWLYDSSSSLCACNHFNPCVVSGSICGVLLLPGSLTQFVFLQVMTRGGKILSNIGIFFYFIICFVYKKKKHFSNKCKKCFKREIKINFYFSFFTCLVSINGRLVWLLFFPNWNKRKKITAHFVKCVVFLHKQLQYWKIKSMAVWIESAPKRKKSWSIWIERKPYRPSPNRHESIKTQDFISLYLFYLQLYVLLLVTNSNTTHTAKVLLLSPVDMHSDTMFHFNRRGFSILSNQVKIWWPQLLTENTKFWFYETKFVY